MAIQQGTHAGKQIGAHNVGSTGSTAGVSGASGGKRVLELHFAARREVVYDIRRQFEEFMRNYATAPDDLESIKVALSEAATNAICHGSPNAEKSRIRVRFECDGHQLVLEVFDQGQGFRPRAIELPEMDEMKPSGRGLWIMEALMDQVAFQPGPEGTCVRLVKRIAPSAVVSRTHGSSTVSTGDTFASTASSHSAPAMMAQGYGE